MIRALMDMGHMEESDATAGLFQEAIPEAEKHTLADQIMLERMDRTPNTRP